MKQMQFPKKLKSDFFAIISLPCWIVIVSEYMVEPQDPKGLDAGRVLWRWKISFQNLPVNSVSITNYTITIL